MNKEVKFREYVVDYSRRVFRTESGEEISFSSERGERLCADMIIEGFVPENFW
jgi:hypothetical protein